MLPHSQESTRSRAALLVGAGVISFAVVVIVMIVARPNRDVAHGPTTGTTREEPMLSVGPQGRSASPVDGSASYPRSDEPRCAANLQRVAAALQAWANQHDWTLPARLPDLVDAGLLDPAHLICPADGPAGTGASPGATSYLYTGAGLRTPVREDVVVAYEPARHFGGVGMHALMGDGSVRLLVGDDAQRLIAAAESGQRPLRIPPANAAG